MKRLLILLLGILMLFSFALAEETAEASAVEEITETENYMVPRMFMSMFNETFPINTALMQLSDEETNRLVETYSLTEYDADESSCYYGSKDWLIEVVFVFEKEEDVSPDSPCVFWYLCLSDDAEESAWYVTMYTLNQMIAYTYRDILSSDVVLNYFQTVNLGDTLELPDGYVLTTLRPDGADYVVFVMEPGSPDETSPAE